MPIVLDVHVLPRGEASRTRKLHDAFMKAYLDAHPDAHWVEVDLAGNFDQLPAFDEWDISAKFEMLYGEGELDELQAERWNRLSALTDQLHTATLVMVSAPMWNFSVPWQLKRWLDCVVQGRLTFEVRDDAYCGLLTGRPAVLITSRDGVYAPGTPYAAMDFHIPYLKTVLGMMGLGPFYEVIAEPMSLAHPEVAAAALEAAVARARELGASVLLGKKLLGLRVGAHVRLLLTGVSMRGWSGEHLDPSLAHDATTFRRSASLTHFRRLARHVDRHPRVVTTSAPTSLERFAGSTGTSAPGRSERGALEVRRHRGTHTNGASGAPSTDARGGEGTDKHKNKKASGAPSTDAEVRRHRETQTKGHRERRRPMPTLSEWRRTKAVAVGLENRSKKQF